MIFYRGRGNRTMLPSHHLLSVSSQFLPRGMLCSASSERNSYRCCEGVQLPARKLLKLVEIMHRACVWLKIWSPKILLVLRLSRCKFDTYSLHPQSSLLPEESSCSIDTEFVKHGNALSTEPQRSHLASNSNVESSFHCVIRSWRWSSYSTALIWRLSQMYCDDNSTTFGGE